MEIITVLEQSGLNQKQASVYMALLELGTGSVQLIAKKAELKRPTTYLVLDELQQKGLVSLVPQKKVLYTAEPPDKLLNDLNRKQEILKRYLPGISALHNSKKEKPQVQLFQGKEGMREVYNLALQYKQIDIFCTVSDVAIIFPDLPKDLKKSANEGTISVREMVTKKDADIVHAKWIGDTDNYEVRHSPIGKEFLTDNFIFGNHVVFCSYQPYLMAVLITSEGISTSLKTLYELAWESAEKVI
jgi:HTH-type transcriptional regulator, sugar sensing transcriptional regulator